VQGFLRKVESQIARLPVSTASGTYPDDLFDQLLNEAGTLPGSSPFFREDLIHLEERCYLLKRTLDIIGAIAGLLLLSPVMLMTAIAIVMTTPGPIIFRQVRVGKWGRPFFFYKFRSMYANADDRIHREFVTKLIRGHLEEVNQGDNDNPHYKLKSDPRVTPIGKFIRDTCIDEIPQLFNVLKGDMSLVGPRPPLPYEVENYKSWHLRRVLEAKPGVTGLWQVNGHSSTTFDDMVRFDLQYANNCSPMLDLKILLSTVGKMLKGIAARL
jgi:lipopolysaccharide/colanic/teichoic acid biosynthesis glycosyltransferase